MPPINDDFADALQLTAPGTVSGDTTGATSDGGAEQTWHGAAVPTIWYYIENDGASDISVEVSNLLGIGAFEGFADLNLWLFAGVAADFDDLDTNSYDDDWVGEYINAPLDASKFFTLAPGDRLYIVANNYFFTDTDFGAFTFDWGIATTPSNDEWANAIDINSLSGTITGTTILSTPTAGMGGYRDVWYRLSPTVNSNGGVFEWDEDSITGGVEVEVYVGYVEDDLLGINPDFNYPIWTATFFGNSTYIRVRSNTGSESNFSFTYTFAPYPAATVGTANANDEVKSPDAPFTHYPGGVVAIRAADYVVGSATTASDASSPNGNYAVDTQDTTASDASQHSNLATSLDDSIVIDLNDLGLETGLWYYVYVLCKTVGTTPVGIGQSRETAIDRHCCRLYYRNDRDVSWNETWDYLPGDAYSGKWIYKLMDPISYEVSEDDILRFRLGQVNTTGLEIRVAQIVLVAAEAVYGSPSPVTNNDFSWDWMPYYDSRDFGPTGDDLTDGLGSRSLDLENPSWMLWAMEYQDVASDPEPGEHLFYPYIIEDFDTVAPMPDVYRYMYWGPEWKKQQTWIDDDFDRTTGPWFGLYRDFPPAGPGSVTQLGYVDYAGNFDYATQGPSVLGSTGGYCWRFSYNLKTSVGDIWDFDGCWTANVFMPAWFEMTGDALTWYVGGGDNGLALMAATLGSGNDGVMTEPPTLRNIKDGIIETQVGWGDTLTVDDDDPNTPVMVGWHQYWGSVENNYERLYLQMYQKSDGTVWAGIKQRIAAPYYYAGGDQVIVDDFEWAAGYSPFDKINIKLRKRGYIVDAKIWYDGDTEPSTWDISGYTKGVARTQYPYTDYIIDYPYWATPPDFTTRTGFESEAMNYPFIASKCSYEHPYWGGTQIEGVQVTWEYIKVTYDPDGDVTKDTNLRIMDDALTETWVETSLPYTREAITYCGLRSWGMVDPDNINDEGVTGSTTYLWLDAGAANLAGTIWGISHSRLYRTFATFISGIISMWWKEGST